MCKKDAKGREKELESIKRKLDRTKEELATEQSRLGKKHKGAAKAQQQQQQQQQTSSTYYTEEYSSTDDDDDVEALTEDNDWKKTAMKTNSGQVYGGGVVSALPSKSKVGNVPKEYFEQQEANYSVFQKKARSIPYDNLSDADRMGIQEQLSIKKATFGDMTSNKTFVPPALKMEDQVNYLKATGQAGASAKFGLPANLGGKQSKPRR